MTRRGRSRRSRRPRRTEAGLRLGDAAQGAPHHGLPGPGPALRPRARMAAATLRDLAQVNAAFSAPHRLPGPAAPAEGRLLTSSRRRPTAWDNEALVGGVPFLTVALSERDISASLFNFTVVVAMRSRPVQRLGVRLSWKRSGTLGAGVPARNSV